MRILVTITYPRDYGWLRHTAKSIERFMTGFDRWVVWVPLPVDPRVERIRAEYRGKVPLVVRWFNEWPKKGMLHHMNTIVHADQLHDKHASSFTTWDADMLLTRPLDSKELFSADGRPILPVRDIPSNPSLAAEAGKWHKAVADAIGIYPETDGMGWLPLTYLPETLVKTRDLIKAHTGRQAEEYIRSCQNEYPQTFAEYNTLSYVAWRFHRAKYDFRQGLEPWGQRTMLHFWSHGGLDYTLHGAPWTVNGKLYSHPREILTDLGFL